ncbi:hypothetical protein [Actinoplanes aureus]|uniref:Uncharacterized protein n=1 Tax=Actinoplanes aureus TaxID=2792083 RepID=A0A931FZL6_9ACTN|nr:hypothetical protein [Actinoplanes aureus]MBG0564897.1 hypothetical protein [Actinoplanes aureus]MBG0569092.1 hypothetical protein [Actinoplanes aureus]
MPDPAQIQTRAQFADALARLKGTRTHREITRALEQRTHADTIVSATISNMTRGTHFPGQQNLTRFLTGCGVIGADQQPWIDARNRLDRKYQPAAATSRPRPLLVSEADPRMLGVHASIQVEPGTTSLPPYVRRDLDDAVCAVITDASANGGMLVLVGGSSVGKTSLLWAGVRAAAPHAQIIQPSQPSDLATMPASMTPQPVIWLDNLPRFLDHRDPLSADVVRTLLSRRMIVLATIWPGHYFARTAPPNPDATGLDPYANDRDILGLAKVIDVPESFSVEELRRARDTDDPRILVALAGGNSRVAQVLAAGPELVRRWTNRTHPTGSALITAALDANRVGATHPVPTDFLRQAAPGYLTEQARAAADELTWFTDALTYATAQVRGGTACLTAVATQIGVIDGYRPADYLVQYASTHRHNERLPDTAWTALIHHHHRDDTTRIARTAERHGCLDIAEDLFRAAMTHREPGARSGLADVLVAQGRVDEAVAAVMNPATNESRREIARILEHRGHQDRAEEILRPAADTGDVAAVSQLAHLLTAMGRPSDALTLLRPYALTDENLASQLVDLLLAGDHDDEAIAVLSAWVAAHPASSLLSIRLIEILEEKQRIDHLRDLSVVPDHSDDPRCPQCGRRPHDDTAHHEQLTADTATTALHRTLAQLDKLDELRAAAAGDDSAAFWLAEGLALHHHTAELHARAQAGDRHAIIVVANMAESTETERRRAIAMLRPLAEAGDEGATRDLASLLAATDLDAAVGLLRPLAERGQILEPLLGSNAVTFDIADLLSEHGRVDDAYQWLMERAAAGSWTAVRYLADLLLRHERPDLLRALSAAGYAIGDVRLADLLADSGRIAELRAESSRGNEHATTRLADLGRRPSP